ncbi:MAG: DNA polymerase I [Caldilineaceae bacterium]
MSTLLLIDGHSQAYRAYFGMKAPLSTRTGELTGAVFGFARKLFSILREYKPDHVGVAFDLGDTWRHDEFAEYKGTRDSMPDDLRAQIGRIEEMLRAFNIPIITYEGYEADDILGTLGRQAGEQGTDVLILTGDRDLFQLVNERVKILYTSGGPSPKTSVYGVAEVRERYGLTPQQFIDLKALTGDSSDNIPGVPGVGEKTAIKFLNTYDTLENLYAHVDEISGPKTRQNLIDSHAQVLKNRRLVTIVTDMDLTYEPERYLLQDYDPEKVIALFNELEFHSLLKELPQAEEAAPESASAVSTVTMPPGQMALFATEDEPAPAAQSAESPALRDYLCVQDEAALAKLVNALKSATRLSFDVETTSTDAMQAKLVGLGVAWEVGQAAYVPLAHTEGAQLPWEKVRDALAPFFADPARLKMAHNGKYDLTVCRRHGLAVAGPIHDTMTMAWLLDPASRSLGLKALALQELGMEMTEITELIGSGRKQITIDQAPLDATGAYCADDVDATLQLYDALWPRLQASGMAPIYTDIELPLLEVLTDMEMAGIRLDTDFLAGMSTELAERLIELESKLFELVGHEFNQRSTQQLSQVLFDELGFPTKFIKKTGSGFYSTAVSELEKLANAELTAEQGQVIEIIMEQRQLEKLRGTYVDALPALVNPETGRVHTSFNQTGAVTGRMSSNSPNLQNIPIRTELGRQIRRAFLAKPGWLLLSADYSQVELRILAHVAKEQGLIDAFNADLDIHAATAARLFGVDLAEVNSSQRGLAKTINFATIYGVSAFGLSSRTEMDTKQAQQFLDQYFETYPAIRDYIDKTLNYARQEGCVQTLLGRKRFFPELMNERLPYNQRQAVERAAINAPIQGTAADIMKIAMNRLHERLQADGLQARMLLQVHDELVLELPPAERDTVVSLIRETMESAYKLDVPLKADVEIGQNWYEMEEA